MANRFVIIGASAAGVSAARTILQYAPDAQVTVLEAQKELPLNKCFFADVLSAEKPITDISIGLSNQRSRLSQCIHTSMRVTAIDRDNKVLSIGDAQSIPYDQLLLTLGTRAVVPSLFVPYLADKSLFCFHTSDDLRTIMQSNTQFRNKSVAVIGSGLSGLEVADALVIRGALVTLLERSDRLFPSLCSQQASSAIEDQAQQFGVTVRLKQSITNVARGIDGALLLSTDQNTHRFDYVFVCTGQRSALSMADKAGLKTFGGGIAVDAFLRSSDPRIFAAGDVALTQHIIRKVSVLSSTWPDAMHQGRVAAQNMLGQNTPYPGVLPVIDSSFFGMHFAALDAEQLNDTDESVVAQQTKGQLLILGQTGGFLHSYVSYGVQALHPVLRRAVLTREPVTSLCTRL